MPKLASSRNLRCSIVLALLVISSHLAAQDSPFQLRVNVDLVTLDAGVTGPNGKAVTNLRREDFEIYEDGQLREIKSFASTETPYNVISLLDCTSSVRNAWPMLTRAYTIFVNKLRPQDRVSLAYFGASARLLLDWTSRAPDMAVAASVMDQQVCGRTDLYRAIDWSLTKLQGVSGRKGVVVFTDGVQTVGPVSKRTDIGGIQVPRIENSRDDRGFQSVLQNVRRGDAVFYFIAVNTDLNPTNLDATLNPSMEYTPLAIYNLQQFRSRMQQIAEASGGRVAFPRKTADVIPVYEQIAAELGSSYSFGFTPMRGTAGSFHAVEVRVRGQGLLVRQSRTGYTEP